jgi:restriction system protein
VPACAASAAWFAALRRGDAERLISDSFQRRGYVVTGFGGSGKGDAVDLGLTRNGERFLVQFRDWNKQQVGIAGVWALTSAIAAQRASGGFVITGGEFTREARKFADLCGIALIDGAALAQFSGETSGSKMPFVAMKLV